MSMANWLQVTWGCLAEAVPETDMGQAGGGGSPVPGDGQEGRGLASLEHLPWASPVPGFLERLLLQCFLHPGWEAGQALICRQESPGLGGLLALLLPGVARFLSSQDPKGLAQSGAEGRWAWAGRGRGLFPLQPNP